MPKTLETGKIGEEQAIAHLKSKGYTILERNWRHKNLEIDIIASDGIFLAIVEVKTRKNADFGAPEIFVDRSKQKKIIRAAHEYVKQKNCEQEIRFDIISVNNASSQLDHIERAYYPDLK